MTICCLLYTSGIRNYTDLFTDARVGKSYLFTFKLAIVATIVVTVLSLVLALGLNSKIKFKSAIRGMSVSYTHLDVYKRQVLHWSRCGRAGGRQIIKSLI